MAAKSRLGRDPLSGKAPNAAPKKSSESPTPSKQKPRPSEAQAQEHGAGAAAAKKKTTKPVSKTRPGPKTPTIPEGSPALSAVEAEAFTFTAGQDSVAALGAAAQPIPTSTLIPEGSHAPSTFESESYAPLKAGNGAGLPIPTSAPIPEGYAAPSTFASESYASAAATEMAEPSPGTIPPIRTSTPVPGREPAPVSEDTDVLPATEIPPAVTTAEAPNTAQVTVGVTGLPTATSPVTVVAPKAFAPSGQPPLPDSGTHPAEIFLRGVLESLAPEGSLRLSLDVDPGSFDLPAEKLFYFSHALQLLVAPLEWSASPGRKLQDDPQFSADLSVRLRAIGLDRHSLRIFDKGLFFSRYLSDISLETEALHPLVLFVVKRHGSIAIKQGHTVEFEIIG